MLIKKRSQLTGKEHTMDIPLTEAQYAEFELKMSSPNRPHIQHLLPQLTPSQREFLLTGITDEEWKDAFGEEDEEDD